MKINDTTNIFNLNENNDVIQKSYKEFLVKNLIPILHLEQDYKLLVFSYNDISRTIQNSLPFQSEYVAALYSKSAIKHIDTIKRIFRKSVTAISDSVIVWPEGDLVRDDTFSESLDKTTTTSCKIESTTNQEITPICVVKFPEWLDKFIFDSLKAQYNPSHDRYAYNLDLDTEESKIYLGTYFPRSFAESYMIFKFFCDNTFIQSEVLNKQAIRILDFGCGSGGASLGIIHAIEAAARTPTSIEIIGIDGNHNSLKLFDKIIRHYGSLGKLNVKLSILPACIESEDDFNEILEIFEDTFDFIITSKAIGELESKKRITQNGYEFFASIFAPLLSEDGVMVILDVTTKDESSGLFLSQKMNYGINRFLSNMKNSFKSIAPCSGLLRMRPCNKRCFFKKEIYVSHSKKSKDLTKFAVRILTRNSSRLDHSLFENFLYNSECKS